MNHVQDHLQREGRACYKRKEYDQALEHFDRAIGRSPSVQLLDNRSACHEKLNDLPAALKDAKKAIQLQREDPTGYLRAGRLLLRMDNRPVALEIYTYGLKNIKHAGQGYDLLRLAHATLQKELSPPTSVDPLTVLPRELAEFILEHFTFQQRINACLVSKQWTGFIRSTANLWQYLDLSNARRKVRTSFISRAINVGRKKLTKATLSNLYDFDKTLDALIRHCQLEDLTLMDTGLQSDNLVASLKRSRHLQALRIRAGTQIGRHTLQDITAALGENLTTLESHFPDGFTFPEVHFGKIRSLSVRAASLPTSFFKHVEQSMPQLQLLDLNITARGIVQLFLPTSISTLRLATTGTIVEPPTPLPHLQELYVNAPAMDSFSLTDGLLKAGEADEEQEATQLRTLGIRVPGFLTPVGLEQLLGLKRLSAVECLAVNCDEEAVSAIVKKLPHLHTVDLSGSDLTGVGVKGLLKLQGLQRLTLNDCRLLGRDAVDWAREQGVRVEHRTSVADGTGKKVRY